MHPETARMLVAQRQRDHIAQAQSSMTEAASAEKDPSSRHLRRAIPLPRYYVTCTRVSAQASPAARRTHSWIIVISPARTA